MSYEVFRKSVEKHGKMKIVFSCLLIGVKGKVKIKNVLAMKTKKPLLNLYQKQFFYLNVFDYAVFFYAVGTRRLGSIRRVS